MLIRLRGCAGWSAPLLFAYCITRVSHDMPQWIMSHKVLFERRYNTQDVKQNYQKKFIFIITCFTKYSNNLLSYPVRYCLCFWTYSELLVHWYRTTRAPISALLRSSINMVECPLKPQALNTLTSFYKNKAQKAVKDCVCKQIIWLYYGTSELKDGNNYSASL